MLDSPQETEIKLYGHSDIFRVSKIKKCGGLFTDTEKCLQDTEKRYISRLDNFCKGSYYLFSCTSSPRFSNFYSECLVKCNSDSRYKALERKLSLNRDYLYHGFDRHHNLFIWRNSSECYILDPDIECIAEKLQPEMEKGMKQICLQGNAMKLQCKVSKIYTIYGLSCSFEC